MRSGGTFLVRGRRSGGDKPLPYDFRFSISDFGFAGQPIDPSTRSLCSFPRDTSINMSSPNSPSDPHIAIPSECLVPLSSRASSTSRGIPSSRRLSPEKSGDPSMKGDVKSTPFLVSVTFALTSESPRLRLRRAVPEPVKNLCDSTFVTPSAIC